MIQIEGKWVDLSGVEYYGGIVDRFTYEDLYRKRTGEWLLHVRNTCQPHKTPAIKTISEDEAVAWLIDLRHNKYVPGAIQRDVRRERESVPYHVLRPEDQMLAGRVSISAPPPIGQINEFIPQAVSLSRKQIEERQERFLEPGRVLRSLMWPPPATVAETQRFHNNKHEDMVERLLIVLEGSLFESPRLINLQSLGDCGCDLLIEWPSRCKYGIQLKSDGDARKKDFHSKTIAQIQDSRQHGLVALYVVLAVDITGNSLKLFADLRGELVP